MWFGFAFDARDGNIDVSCSMFNARVPYNVSPGSQADLSAVVAHYERQNKEIDESRAARMKDGKGIYE